MQFYKTVRPILFLLKPETAHTLTVSGLSFLGRILPKPGRDDYILKQTFFGQDFDNPIGLAAGFDKNGEAVDGVLKLGFGFTEIGTVTPQPQAGNPKPRIFRLKNHEAVINRLGFNNQGHETVRTRLSRRAPYGIVGVNIGANKTARDRIADYQSGAEVFREYASYLTVNVSSPNTPGLRDLQAGKPLKELLGKVRAAAPDRPIFLKIAPDLDDAQLGEIAKTALAAKVDGLIISNTTISREPVAGDALAQEEGGLSGRPLMEMSTQVLAKMRLLTRGRLILIGAGGIADAQDAYAKIKSGASLLQLYSALTYQGPGLVSRLKRELAELLREDGYTNVSEAVGADVPLTVRKTKSASAKSTKPAKSQTQSKSKKRPAVNTTSAQIKDTKAKGKRTMSATIYHNPRCSKSRQTLALLEDKGEKVKIVEYLKDPLTAAEIEAVLKKLKLGPADVLRKGEKIYKELQLKDVTDDGKLIAAMAENPILIERPIVVKGRKAALGRPPENVLSIL